MQRVLCKMTKKKLIIMIMVFTSSLNWSKRGLYSLGPTLLKPVSALHKEKAYMVTHASGSYKLLYYKFN